MSNPTSCALGALVLACGALSTACSGGSSPASIFQSSTPVDLQLVQNRVFTPSCAVSGCHVGAAAPFGLDLSDGLAAGNLIGVASAEVPAFERITPFDVSDSYLHMKLVDDPRISGDQMPFGSSLSMADLELVERWIELGAPR